MGEHLQDRTHREEAPGMKLRDKVVGKQRERRGEAAGKKRGGTEVVSEAADKRLV